MLGEKHLAEQSSRVLGNDLPQVVQVLKARYGEEFAEKNIRRASKQSYGKSACNITPSTDVSAGTFIYELLTRC